VLHAGIGLIILSTDAKIFKTATDVQSAYNMHDWLPY